jgi:hypothetical protein
VKPSQSEAAKLRLMPPWLRGMPARDFEIGVRTAYAFAGDFVANVPCPTASI